MKHVAGEKNICDMYKERHLTLTFHGSDNAHTDPVFVGGTQNSLSK